MWDAKKKTLLNVISSKHRSKFTAIHGQSWRLNWYVLNGMGKKINQLFYGPLENIWLISRRHHCRWRGCKFRTVLGTQGLWAWRDLFGVTPAVTRGLGFSGLIRMTTPFNHLLLLVKGWKIKAYAEYSGPLSREGSMLWHGASVFLVSSNGPHRLRYARGVQGKYFNQDPQVLWIDF